jgi:hypothetical protein
VLKPGTFSFSAISPGCSDLGSRAGPDFPSVPLVGEVRILPLIFTASLSCAPKCACLFFLSVVSVLSGFSCRCASRRSTCSVLNLSGHLQSQALHSGFVSGIRLRDSVLLGSSHAHVFTTIFCRWCVAEFLADFPVGCCASFCGKVFVFRLVRHPPIVTWCSPAWLENPCSCCLFFSCSHVYVKKYLIVRLLVRAKFGLIFELPDQKV